MNAPVIADQLISAVRRISPAADISVEPDLTGDRPQMLIVRMGTSEAMALIDFIGEHTPSYGRPAPNQPSLFDQEA
jgi:hypothetical protein